MMKSIVAAFLLAGIAIVAGLALHLLVRLRWPARIPPDLRFTHEVMSTKHLRVIAGSLAARFVGPTPDNVVCLGPVRGNAARVLFHSGANNTGKNRNIHRPDYILHIKRLSKERVALELDTNTNRPYSYLRIRRAEVEPLTRALLEQFGSVREI
jgi:hypothetical protein